MTASFSVTTDGLRKTVVDVYRRGGGSRPDVLCVRHNGERLVLKDFNGCDRWFGLIFGAFLARREARAMRQLAGLSGVPAFIAQPGPRALLMQHLDAAPVLKTGHRVNWPSFFSALESTIAAMHAQGVAHCDLRSPHNVLVDRAGKPWLVDFTGAWCGKANPVSKCLFSQLAGVDRSAVVKLKGRVAPELLTTEDLLQLERRHPLDRPARVTGQSVRRLARSLFTRR